MNDALVVLHAPDGVDWGGSDVRASASASPPAATSRCCRLATVLLTTRTRAMALSCATSSESTSSRSPT
jgi:hypothetical protein